MQLSSPKKTWRRTFEEDLTRANITWQEAYTLRWIVFPGVKLLPNVPTGTGGTKSKYPITLTILTLYITNTIPNTNPNPNPNIPNHNRT